MELTENYISQKKNNKHEDTIELIQNERNIQKKIRESLSC